MLKTMKGALLGATALVWAGAALAQDAEQPDIGVIVPTLDAQFWNSYVEFMEKGAEELGVNLTVLNADNKPDQMIKSLEDLVAQGVDGIIYTPYWATAGAWPDARPTTRASR
jgi:ABC-type sugar transport system substrate-binding protein